jgi:hypothetical protein
VDITFLESTYEGSYSRTLGDVRIVGGKFDRLDLDDIDINFDSDTNIRVRIGNAGLGTTAFQTGAVPGGLKNSGISLSKQNGAVRLTNTGAITDVTLNNSDVGLANVTNHTQIKTDLSNLTINSTDLEVSGGSLQAKNALKNNQVTLAKDSSGNISLNNAGSGNISLDNSDVGLSNVDNFQQLRQDLVNAPSGVLNTSISLSAAGVLTGGGTSTQVNVGSIANSPFDTSGNVDTGEEIQVGSKLKINRNNEQILVED